MSTISSPSSRVTVPESILDYMRREVRLYLGNLGDELEHFAERDEPLEYVFEEIQRVGYAHFALLQDTDRFPADVVAVGVEAALRDAMSRIEDDVLGTVEEAERLVRLVRELEALREGTA